MALSVSLHLYQIEFNSNTNTWFKVGVYPKDVAVSDIKTVAPVNALLALSLPGLPYLYGKLLMRVPGLNQEMFVLQSVAQMHTLINS